jgi:predicted XRE-type DNA-binding protein
MTEEHDRRESEVFDSSGNVFADLGLPSSEEDMMKVAIARAIATTLKKRDLTQAEAAKIIGVDQAKLSAVTRGRLKDYSVERLLRWLIALGRDVDIRISQRYHRTRPGRVSVSEAA